MLNHSNDDIIWQYEQLFNNIIIQYIFEEEESSRNTFFVPYVMKTIENTTPEPLWSSLKKTSKQLNIAGDENV